MKCSEQVRIISYLQMLYTIIEMVFIVVIAFSCSSIFRIC